MSVTSALSNALSGLKAVSTAADVVSSNVSNAMTEGYKTRSVELSSQTIGRAGAGVNVVSIARNTDPTVTQERRLAGSEVAADETRQGFHSNLATSFGTISEEGSLASHISNLEASLVAAASRPESEPRLRDVLLSATDLASKFNAAADTLSAQRTQAENSISEQVDMLQALLTQVVDLNIAIQDGSTSGRDVNTLLDQRGVLVDRISDIVPVKEVQRSNNMIAIFTTGGSVLLESKAATLEFTPIHTITPDMSLASGALNQLYVNGQPVSFSGGEGQLGGGSLGALFELRDEIIPQSQSRLDAVARDLIERFESSTADPSLTPGMAGLFTDNGGAFDALDEIGVSGRLTVNTAIDPDQGGDLWRIRDGIGAAAQGPTGQASTLLSLKAALTEQRVTPSGGFTNVGRSAAELMADLHSVTETELWHLEQGLAQSTAAHDIYRSQELANGVDTDSEMQKLLVIEQNYAANAKVIQTINTLIDQLMGVLA